ncbi:MAG: T9SS type B sorting domain-containing protein, partial [Bacteroidia bacterium]|nr:T9SS type B sorting domain-containing protein [Bacteroidia bacterium]
PFSQTLFVRVESSDNGACFGIGPHLQLQVYPRPEFEVIQQDIFCLNGQPALIETFNPSGDFEYEWTDESGNIISDESSALISSGGLYTVTAYSAEGCASFPEIFNVIESGISTADEDDILVEDLSNNNSITVNTSDLGPGDYEFSLDSIEGPYQDEAVFSSVGAGDHTVYIRDKNGCGIQEIPVFVLGFPKFFTPNNDGYNDSWNIKGWNESISVDSRIRIFNRYGKLIKELSAGGEGWNGTFNGSAMHASDYWFVAELIQSDGSSRVIRGHFSLVR